MLSWLVLFTHRLAQAQPSVEPWILSQPMANATDKKGSGLLVALTNHDHLTPQDKERNLQGTNLLGYTLLRAASAGCQACVTALIDNCGVDANYKSLTRGYTALDHAQWGQHSNMSMLLTEKGCVRTICQAGELTADQQ